MKNKGFTLIEMIAVVLIMAMLTLIILPTITNQIRSQRDSISSTSLQLIYSANELYLQEKKYDFPMYEGATYCVTLEELVNDGKLKSPIQDLKTGKEITLNQTVKTEVNTYGDGEYTLVAPTECETVYPEIPDDPREEDTLYVEASLNGADPVLKDNLIPVKISSTGIVRRADLNQKWYSYSNREWANAIILKDSTRVYNPGDVIAEENIESYFVWIPKYSYQLWDMGNYDSLTAVDNSKVHTISVRFGLENTIDSKSGECTTPGVAGESGNCKVGDYMTHPAFLAFNSNGFWVGKFETGYDGATTTTEAEINESVTGNVIIKPNAYSWRSITLGNAFKTSYDYMRNLDSHMMKNTEWGAVAYLQHSRFGSHTSVRINNNSAYITGYASTQEPSLGVSRNSIDGNRFESVASGEDGTYTVNYFNIGSIVASTTGNITGIYDMNGGAYEYVASYTTGATKVGGSSGITDLYSDFFTSANWNKYYDKYASTEITNYNNRILGDATGELGPYYEKSDEDNASRIRSSWYGDFANFSSKSSPWLNRGGRFSLGTLSGNFAFYVAVGGGENNASFRIVLTP